MTRWSGPCVTRRRDFFVAKLAREYGRRSALQEKQLSAAPRQNVRRQSPGEVAPRLAADPLSVLGRALGGDLEARGAVEA